MKSAVLDLTAIVNVLNVDRDTLAARLLGNENVLDLFDLERADTIGSDSAVLLIEVALRLTSKGRGDFDGAISELQFGISYRHGWDYIRFRGGVNWFSNYFLIFVAHHTINEIKASDTIISMLSGNISSERFSCRL